MLDILRNITQEVNAASSLEEAMDLVVVRVCESMTVKVCSLYLRDENDNFVLRATKGLKKEAIGHVSMTQHQGLVGYVAKRGEAINLENAEAHSRYLYFPETGEERFASFLGVPIIHQRQVLGVLALQQKHRRRFSESEEALLLTLSALLAGIIAHAKAAGDLEQYSEGPAEASFRGMPAVNGIAIGTAVVYSPTAGLTSVPFQRIKDVDNEMRIFDQALKVTRAEIKALGKKLQDRITIKENALFDVYLAMLGDTTMIREVKTIIQKSIAAPYAWSQVILKHSQTFSAMDDPYLSERSADMRDLGRRVLSCLQQSVEKKRIYPDNTILIGDELTASVLGEIPLDKLVGLVSVKGSANSHMAILAKTMGIPTIMGAADFPFTKFDDSLIVVDGYRGKVYINPNNDVLAEFEALLIEDEVIVKSYESLRDLPCETTDNHRISLWVNTGLMADVTRSIQRGAEGVGLYRTEVPFLFRDRFPTETEQCNIYREQLAAFAPDKVTMRTLDIGGDKPLSYFPINEANPFLGWRGIRVTLDHPEIFLAQVRAMMRASEGLDNLQIMLPMVSTIPELEEAQELIRRGYNELLEEGLSIKMPPVGVMIEVPAAVYQAREIAARSDFLSVGSNDLTQYLLAVDRNNSQVADLFNSYHPAVLQALKSIVASAHSENTPLSICGEMAGEPGSAILLMAMGFDVLSMNSTNLPKIKSIIRSISLVQAKELLEKVLLLHDAKSVGDCVDNALIEFGFSSRPKSLML
jgi:phosphotransferase system enzyme I (PtsP)